MLGTELNFRPDWVVAPGATIESWLDECGMTQAELARRLGVSAKALNQMIHGKAPISQQTALRLETVTWIPAKTWNALEANYRETLERHRQEALIAAETEWVAALPDKWLREQGWVAATRRESGRLGAEALQFFGTATVAAWRDLWQRPLAAYRKSEALAADPTHLAVWLRAGELLAAHIEAEEYSQSATRAAAKDVRALTVHPFEVAWPRVQDALAAAGIRAVFVSDPGKTRASGATRWVAGRPILQLSGRFRSDDQLWFALFHELGHVILHGSAATFIEGGAGLNDEQEQQANDFAATLLIPPVWSDRLVGKAWSADKVEALAGEIGVSPGILVGRLQFLGLVPRRSLNRLKASVDVDALAMSRYSSASK